MTRTTWAWCVVVAVTWSMASSVAVAQDSMSSALATDLVRQLDARKLDSAAARLGPDEWVGALYLSGSQLLVVRGVYSGPVRLDGLVSQKAFRELYINLNSASDPASKVLISDLGANGLRARRGTGEPADRADLGGKTYAFDGDWARARITEVEYTAAFRMADEQYAQMLRALLAELQKGS